jgi:hypothetical protein
MWLALFYICRAIFGMDIDNKIGASRNTRMKGKSGKKQGIRGCKKQKLKKERRIEKTK